MQCPVPLDAALTPDQAFILESGMLEVGFHTILQLPTGSGKTWLAERAMATVLARGARALYLTPLRALASELAAKWQRDFSSIQVGVFTGDYAGQGKSYPVPFCDARLLIMTPERLDACTRAWRTHWGWIPEVDICVVDELHLLGNGRRGARLEGALSRLQRLNPFLFLLGLSATLGNREEIADWLEAVEYHSTARPIPLQWKIARYRKASEKPDMLVREVTRGVVSGGKSLVFVQSRRRSENLSRYLQAYGLRAHHHHAGLAYEERRTVERDFRESLLDALVATSSLELGLNLPAAQVVLYDIQEFDGISFTPLGTNTIWQRAGRAGRPGLDMHGEVVLFASQWDRDVKYYQRGEFEPIRSGLSDKRALAEQIVVEVSSGLASTSLHLGRIFAQSLAAHQKILPNVDATIDEMCAVGMLRSTAVEHSSNDRVMALPRLEATQLGRISVRHFLSPTTVLLFRRVLESEHTLSFLDVLLPAACSDECDPRLPVDFESLDVLSRDLGKEVFSLLQLPLNEIVHLIGASGKRLLVGIKMALVARSWTRLGDASLVASVYGCYPSDVARLVASLERLLAAMTDLVHRGGVQSSEPVVPGSPIPLFERIQTLHRMIATGLDEEAATLTLVDGVGPKMSKRLCALGIHDIEALALAAPLDVCQIKGVSQSRARRWIEQAQMLIKTKSAFRYKEAESLVQFVPSTWPDGTDPYRLRRALDLNVEQLGADQYLVTGGLEPHHVRIDADRICCDCPDARNEHRCKHVLAVRLHQGDEPLSALVRAIRSSSPARLDLSRLWFDEHVPTRYER